MARASNHRRVVCPEPRKPVSTQSKRQREARVSFSCWLVGLNGELRVLSSVPFLRSGGISLRFALGIQCAYFATIQCSAEHTEFIHRAAEISDHEWVVLREAFGIPVAQLRRADAEGRRDFQCVLTDLRAV